MNERKKDGETEREISSSAYCTLHTLMNPTEKTKIESANKQTIQLNCEIVFMLIAVDNLSAALTFFVYVYVCVFG